MIMEIVLSATPNNSPMEDVVNMENTGNHIPESVSQFSNTNFVKKQPLINSVTVKNANQAIIFHLMAKSVQRREKLLWINSALNKTSPYKTVLKPKTLPPVSNVMVK